MKKSGTGAWAAAVREHEVVLRGYIQRLHAVPDEQWGATRAEGKWSVAQEALHVAMAYEMGIGQRVHCVRRTGGDHPFTSCTRTSGRFARLPRFGC